MIRMDFIDGVEPPPMRLKVERDKIEKGNRRRSRGDYGMRVPGIPISKTLSMPVHETEAWATYQAQLAAGLGERDDLPAPKREPKKVCPNKVKEFREALGWNQSDLARRSGLTRRTVSNVERGFSSHHRTKLILLRALKLDEDRYDELF